MSRVIESMNQPRKEVDSKAIIEEITQLVKLGRKVFESWNGNPSELPMYANSMSHSIESGNH